MGRERSECISAVARNIPIRALFPLNELVCQRPKEGRGEGGKNMGERRERKEGERDTVSLAKVFVRNPLKKIK